MKVLVLSSSPRRAGNSAVLAQHAALGAEAAGHDVESLHLSEFVNGVLGDCRLCRNAHGQCSIDDRYRTLLLEHLVPAAAVVYATSLHYYGMTSRSKAFFDRLFCYTAKSAPGSDEVLAGLIGQRVGLLISCEESYQGATLGVIAQFQELTRYHRQELVGVVVGVSNARGEVEWDPSNPGQRAYELGERLFTAQVTDYRLNTPRSNRVWADYGVPVPPCAGTSAPTHL